MRKSHVVRPAASQARLVAVPAGLSRGGTSQLSFTIHSLEQSAKGFTTLKICWNNPQIRGLLFTGAWYLSVSYHSQDQSANGIRYAQELLE